MIITREFKVRVRHEPEAYYFTIAQDQWGDLSIIKIETPRGPMQYPIPLPEDIVNAMCAAMEIVKAGGGCVDTPPSGSTGVTGVTGVTGNPSCTGFTFL